MMRNDRIRLAPRQSRAAAIALALAALLIAYFLLLHWWFVAPLLDVRAQMRDLRDVHARYAAAIAARPQLEKRLAALDQGNAASSAFLPETDPSAAAADLIQRASDVVAAHAHEGNGCVMPQKMPVEGGAGKEPYRRISVSITLECGVQPLAATLYDFERALPYLFVDDISLYQAPGAAGRLEVQFTLSGYIRSANAGTPP